MNLAFYFSAAIAVLATALAITRRDAVHGLLYLVVSLLAAAVVFFVLGAPFAAALEVITYAGAMMVMLLVALMTLPREKKDATPGPGDRPRRIWLGPLLLTVVLAGEFGFVLAAGKSVALSGGNIPPGRVGAILFGPYVLAVELASMLLLAGLVGAYHLGKHRSTNHPTRRS